MNAIYVKPIKVCSQICVPCDVLEYDMLYKYNIEDIEDRLVEGLVRELIKSEDFRNMINFDKKLDLTNRCVKVKAELVLDGKIVVKNE